MPHVHSLHMLSVRLESATQPAIFETTKRTPGYAGERIELARHLFDGRR